MYAGMFRTAMDWCQDAGEFLQAPSYDFMNSDDNANDTNEVSDLMNQEPTHDALDQGEEVDSGSGTDDDSSSEEESESNFE